jgi:uncharacterized protein (TIRG00374 family)
MRPGPAAPSENPGVAMVGARRPGPAHELLSASRYRSPGDVIRLIAGCALLAISLVPLTLGAGRELATGAPVVTGGESELTGRVLTATVQAAFVAAAVVAVAATLGRRRFRLFVGLVVAAAVAALATAGILQLVGGDIPDAVPAQPEDGAPVSSFPGPPLIASAAAVIAAASPWLSRSWRRAAWVALLLAVVARWITGAVPLVEIVLALATGMTVGAGLLVILGVPDRRIGPVGIGQALRTGGLEIDSVWAAPVEAKGCRPFVAHAADGRTLFVKAVGPDQRDADLLYRAYRAVRLRDVGDTRPAASLFAAVEHQALVGVMAQRAGVLVPSVDRVVRADDGTGLLSMQWVDGTSLDRIEPRDITDTLLGQLWSEVRTLHSARIAHRSLRSANVMVDRSGLPWIVDFSFSELDATERQMDLDVAELLASLAGLVGEVRAVSTAASVLGAQGIAPAVPLLQPLALSAATRRAVSRDGGLLERTRAQAAAAGGVPAEELARLQRVRPRTLVAIAAASAAFYVLLPRLAQVESSWRALQQAQWIWLPVVIACSIATYLASAVSLLGAVPNRPPFGPTVLAQGASSFVNRVSPSNVGGMALNVRYLQKTGVGATEGVAAVGVNSLAGGVVHLVLLVVFLAWAGRSVSSAFRLPSSSKLLVMIAIAAAIVGLVLATRRGRKFVAGKVLPGIRSSLANLRRVAVSPVKLTLLFGGSALVTLAYIAGLAASMQAFGAGASVAEIGAIYLFASIIAAASPTPGGLGAIEAALVAGLTGLGIPSGAAVSAVLTYRLATYWLPVVPGWFSLRALQRWEYL